MPSAANIKVDKQITSETASVDSTSTQQNTPIRQAIIVIEHKIRNLEKRKAKLESYKELQRTGKDLNQDQRVAIAKYDEVVQTLEFARDLCKQFQGIAAVADKEAKKLIRKEAAAKSQAEIAKVREVLLVQDALQQLGHDTVREDFLLGRNGAVTLPETDLKLLDDIYPEVSPKHEPGFPANFMTQVQTAAEHLLAVVDGKPRDVFGSTYSHIKEVIGKIHESGYFDQAPADTNELEYVEETQEEILVEPEVKVEHIPEIGVYQVEPAIVQEEVAVVAAPPVLEQQFYQQPRPISEVLGTGTFFFLQDSELDSPEQTPQNPVITPAAIPSQTFTNQNFVPMTEGVAPRQNPIAGFAPAPSNPPPPIPMPPSHLPGMEFAPIQGSPIAYQNYQEEIPQQQPPPQQPPPQIISHVDTSSRNGEELVKIPEEPVSGSPKNNSRPRNNQRRAGPGQSGNNSGYHQSYYQHQHNNGYSNSRQRTGRGSAAGGAPRSGGNRPVSQKPKQAQH